MPHSNLMHELRGSDPASGGPLWVAVSNPGGARAPAGARPAPRAVPVRYSHALDVAIGDVAAGGPQTGTAVRGDPGMAFDSVCAGWDDALRQGLIQTAFLARLTRAVVLELTRSPSVADVLDRMADEGLLVQRTVMAPAIMRYEPRFRAHLQALARSSLQSGELSELLWRVATLMERELEALQPAPLSGQVSARAALPRLQICALGGFLILRDGAPLPRHRKAPGKPLTLLKALVALGATGVPSHTLADLLWPEAEGDSADARLTTTLHRARALLGVHEAVLKDSGQLSLNRALVRCDVFDFQDLLQRLETEHADAAAMGKLLLKAYPGPLLPACTGEAWLQPCRERLAAKFAAAAARIGRWLEAAGNRDEARAFTLEAVAREPLAACLRRFL